SFNGSIAGNGAILNWKTANEESLHLFEVEWSLNGTSWQQISTVTARGGYGGGADYTTSHTLSSGINFCRLKMIDLDGRYTYSSILRLVKDEKTGITLYPNPASETVILAMQGTGPARIKIYSASGQIVYNKETNSNSLAMNIAHLPSGFYTVEISRDGVISREKLMKK
ncbi:MAG: T9SS type A sorting domain-containing protein, partial [Chitinophagaceae bacterium]|nr:T9SS type A sorting domain-containing protein [Chitinophagaceae bacterium]